MEPSTMMEPLTPRTKERAWSMGLNLKGNNKKKAGILDRVKSDYVGNLNLNTDSNIPSEVIDSTLDGTTESTLSDSSESKHDKNNTEDVTDDNENKTKRKSHNTNSKSEHNVEAKHYLNIDKRMSFILNQTNKEEKCEVENYSPTILSCDITDTILLITNAKKLLSKGLYQDALNLFDLALHFDKQCMVAILGKGLVYYNCGNYKEALKLFFLYNMNITNDSKKKALVSNYIGCTYCMSTKDGNIKTLKNSSNYFDIAIKYDKDDDIPLINKSISQMLSNDFLSVEDKSSDDCNNILKRFEYSLLNKTYKPYHDKKTNGIIQYYTIFNNPNYFLDSPKEIQLRILNVDYQMKICRTIHHIKYRMLYITLAHIEGKNKMVNCEYNDILEIIISNYLVPLQNCKQYTWELVKDAIIHIEMLNNLLDNMVDGLFKLH